MNHKQLKTMEMSAEAWPDTYDEGYIYINSNLNPLTKFNSCSWEALSLKTSPLKI